MKIHLVFGLITALLLVIVIGSRRQEPTSFKDVAKLAEGMAREDYLSATPALPKPLRDLTAEQYQQIKWKDEKTLWRREGLPFQVRFSPPGYIYDNLGPMAIQEISRGNSTVIPFSPSFFDFSPELAALKLPTGNGYAGFRLYHPLNKPDVLDELLSFLGHSDFRAVVAHDLVYGLSARALLINPGDDHKDEEIPVFTKFWLKRPDTFSSQFTLFALLESRSVTGAYQFDIESGAETKMNVKARLYFHRTVKQVGYAPLISMFWFGENTSNTFGDFRPEVHRSDGLLMQRTNGEWIWHPLTWAREAQVNIFDRAGPKGFGLLQRDRDFSHYQDLKALFHKMPSVWVQPVKGFESGRVYLAQQPARDENHDNIQAYWVPDAIPVPLQPVDLEYTLRWFTDATDLPPLGRCLSTRVDFQEETDRRQFFLDFAGGALDKLREGEEPQAEVASPTDATITEKKIEKNDFNHSWRVSFFVTANQKVKPTEVLCRLMTNGTAATETWTYTWIP